MTELTPAQSRQWGKVVKSSAALNMRTKALGIRAKNLIDAVNIAREGGVDLSGITDYLVSVDVAQQKDSKLQLAIGAVMTGDLGVRFRGGDIDIMAPPGTSDDELAQYHGFGIVMIVIGIVVVASIAWTLATRHDENKLLKRKYDKAIREADSIICANPSSPMCQKWTEKKRSVEHMKRKTAFERLENGAQSIMSSIVSGSKWGVALAIPLIVLFVSNWLKRSGSE